MEYTRKCCGTCLNWEGKTQLIGKNVHCYDEKAKCKKMPYLDETYQYTCPCWGKWVQKYKNDKNLNNSNGLDFAQGLLVLGAGLVAALVTNNKKNNNSVNSKFQNFKTYNNSEDNIVNSKVDDKVKTTKKDLTENKTKEPKHYDEKTIEATKELVKRLFGG